MCEITATNEKFGFRPVARPEDLIETTERASLDGFTRAELAEFRPKLRPKSAQENVLGYHES